MTALQRQLAAVAATSSHELDLKGKKLAHTESLLFEPSVAATQSLDVLYQICIEGFEELCMLDSRFCRYRTSLFSFQSKNEERELLTTQENEKLDTVLDGFLRLVGVHLVLKPALKAVEWLVRKFRVHELNTASLVLTFLPYHATRIFSNLLAILPKRLPTSFKFLHPYVATRGCPPHQAVVYAVSHNHNLFVVFNQHMLDVIRMVNHSCIFLSFWATTALQAVENMLKSAQSGRYQVQRQSEDDVITTVLSVINQALSLREISDVVLATYTIITVLVSRATLDERALNALLTTVTFSWTSQTVDAGLRCLAVVIERKEVLSIPKAVKRKLSRLEGLQTRLGDLSGYQSISRLWPGLGLTANRLLEVRGKERQPSDILPVDVCEPTAAKVIAQTALPHPLKDPASLDSIARLFCIAPSNEERRKALRQFTGQVVSMRVPHKALPYALIALGDRSAKIRRDGVDLVTTIHKSMAFENAGTVQTFIYLYLLDSLEECATHSTHIDHVLEAAFSISSRLKSSQKLDLVRCISDEALTMTAVKGRSRLLSMLSRIDKIASQPRSRVLTNHILQWISADRIDLEASCRAEGVDIGAMDEQILALVHPSDQEALTILLSLANGMHDAQLSLRMAALHRLGIMWSSLKDARQIAVASSLLDMSLKNPEGSSQPYVYEAAALLKKLPIPSSVLYGLLSEALEKLKLHSQPSRAKRRRTHGGELSNNYDRVYEVPDFARLTVLLEVSDGKRLEADLGLFCCLFEILRILQDYTPRPSLSLGYLQSLALRMLSSLIGEMKADLSSTVHNRSLIWTDVLVDCLRNTTNVQTQNDTLTVLSGLVVYAPRIALHSVMPVFTLLNTTTVQQSDGLSIHIVDQTIRSIMPIVAKTLRGQQIEVVSATAEVLLSFAVAFEHVPQTRRLQLFSLLASSLGVEDCLFAILATLIGRYPGNGEVLRFAVDLCQQFHTGESLKTLLRYLDLVLKDSHITPSLLSRLTKTDQHNTESLDLLSLLPQLFNDDMFRKRLQDDLCGPNKHAEALRATLGDLLQRVVEITWVTTELPVSKPSCTATLQCIVHLLPFDAFARFLEPLLQEDRAEICKTLLMALDLRISSVKVFNPADKDSVTLLLLRITQILETSFDTSLTSIAITCMEKLCERFRKLNLAATYKAAEAVSGFSGLGNPDAAVRTLSLHCVCSMLEQLGMEILPLLQIVLQAALGSLKESLAGPLQNVKLHNASFALFVSVIDYMPFMLSESQFADMLSLAHQSAASDMDPEATTVRSLFFQSAATRLDVRLLFAVATVVWPSALESGSTAVNEHISLLRMAVRNNSKAIVSHCAQKLLQVFPSMLDLRRTRLEDGRVGLYSDEQLENLELQTMETFLALVMKITDAKFRPFFIELLKWACAHLAAENSPGSILRSTTFFNLVNFLSENLKSLFTSYFSYILEPASEILSWESFPADHYKQAAKVSLLQALSSSFRHDHDDFWLVPTHFNTIAGAITSLLTSTPAFQVSTFVIPAITDFAAATTSSQCHRTLNDMLLKLLRSENAYQRLSGIQCQQALTKCLGDSWLSLLPEMLPVIHELQDDDNEDVEAETIKWIRMIESTLGESLQAMLL